MKILIVDDDPISRSVEKAILLKWGYEVIEAENGDQAWQVLADWDAPRLVLLDWMMPGLDGIELCRRLRRSNHGSYHYVILLTSRDSQEDIIEGLDAGADDYLTKPFVARELEVRLRAGCRIVELQNSLQEALELQRYQARHDPLTGLLNHGAILQILEKELDRSHRYGDSLAVLMGDLDHFKRVNDRYGHTAGDAVLLEIAQRISKTIRLYDAVGRYGGEEFLLVLPGCSGYEAMQIANRVLESVGKEPVKVGPFSILVTISLGLAVNLAGQQIGTTKLVQAADQALYQAKKRGRNRVERFEVSEKGQEEATS